MFCFVFRWKAKPWEGKAGKETIDRVHAPVPVVQVVIGWRSGLDKRRSDLLMHHQAH